MSKPPANVIKLKDETPIPRSEVDKIVGEMLNTNISYAQLEQKHGKENVEKAIEVMGRGIKKIEKMVVRSSKEKKLGALDR